MESTISTERQNNQITPFNFGACTLRAVLRGGEPWFVAKDVCDALGIANGRDAVAQLDDDEKFGVGIADAKALGFDHATAGVNIVNESGLYALIFKSRKPEAKVFRKWVTMEVLPAIRRTGAYSVAGARNPSLDGPVVREMLEVIRQNTAVVEKLSRELESQKLVANRHIVALATDAADDGEWLNTTQLMAVYGKTRATVISHARAMGWEMRVSALKSSGSLTFEYRLSSLPENLQKAWAEMKAANAAAGNGPLFAEGGAK